MGRWLAILALVAILSIAGAGYWVTLRSDGDVVLPAPPENIDAAFTRREAIVAEMLSDPRTWAEHLDIAARLLDQERWMFQADRLWTLDEVYAQDKQLTFQFIARQPETLLAMPDWRGDDKNFSIGALFTNSAFRWICTLPESAAIWDVHTRLYKGDEIVVLRILVLTRDGEFLREIPMELLPCADRNAVSEG